MPRIEELRSGDPDPIRTSGRGGSPEADGVAAAAHLEVRHVSGRSVTTRAHATAPVKLLTPRRRGGAAWVYLSTFGGGLVAADRVQLYADIHEGSTAVLTTQAATKIFHQQDGVGAQQTLQLSLIHI